MAGYMYLGNKKVCPAVLVGSQPEPVNYDSLLKVPNGVKDLNVRLFSSITTNEDETEPYPPPQKFLVDLNEVEEISGSFAVYAVFFFFDYSQCSIRADNLKTISGYGAFNYFMNTRPVNAPTPSFYEPEIHFPKLETISQQCFFGFVADGITDVYFESLHSVNQWAFAGMIRPSVQVTLHFPSNLSEIIPTLTDYPNFGGTNTVILYDLPATE